jgi:hypothetical protein
MLVEEGYLLSIQDIQDLTWEQIKMFTTRIKEDRDLKEANQKLQMKKAR